jgi:hypothetical protein
VPSKLHAVVPLFPTLRPVGCFRDPLQIVEGRSCRPCVIVQTSAYPLLCTRVPVSQRETPNILSPSYTRFLIERRQDAYTLFTPFSGIIPQFALFSLSLGIGVTIARLSQTRALPWSRRDIQVNPGPRLKEGQATVVRHYWGCSSWHPSPDP